MPMNPAQPVTRTGVGGRHDQRTAGSTRQSTTLRTFMPPFLPRRSRFAFHGIIAAAVGGRDEFTGTGRSRGHHRGFAHDQTRTQGERPGHARGVRGAVGAAQSEHERILRGFRASLAPRPARGGFAVSAILVVRPSSLGDIVHALTLVADVRAHRPGSGDRLGRRDRIRAADRTPSGHPSHRSRRAAALAASPLRGVDLARIRVVPQRAAPRGVRGRARPAGTDQGGADRPDGARRAARPGPRQHSGACRVARARRASRNRPRSAFHRAMSPAGRRRPRLPGRGSAPVRPRATAPAGRHPRPIARLSWSCTARRAPTSCGPTRIGGAWSRRSRRRASRSSCPGAATPNARAASGTPRASPTRSVPPPPRLTLPALAGLLARAELAVGVDTGLVHLAAALGTPTVSLFVATDPMRCGVGPAGPHARDLGGVGSIPTPEAVERVAGELMRRAPRC